MRSKRSRVREGARRREIRKPGDLPTERFSPTGQGEGRAFDFPKRGTFRDVKRVDFLINRKRVKRDKKAPFVQVVTIPNPVAGRTYTLRTKALIKRAGKRKLQRKALSVKVTVCA